MKFSMTPECQQILHTVATLVAILAPIFVAIFWGIDARQQANNEPIRQDIATLRSAIILNESRASANNSQALQAVVQNTNEIKDLRDDVKMLIRLQLDK